MKQIPLQLSVPASYAEPDFLTTPDNEATVRFVLKPHLWGTYGCILTGTEASGKTHLGRIWQQQNNAHGLKVASVDVDLSREPWHKAVMLDDADAWLAAPTSLFHVLNRCREAASLCLIVLPPDFKDRITLLDLRSRLLALPVKMLPAPSDELLRAIVQKHFADRQLRVEPAVVEFILARAERSPAALSQMVAALDHAALERKQAITVPLVKRILEPARSITDNT